MRILITGSCGLVGSEAVTFYAKSGHDVWGIDNNLRSYFFGPAGSTLPIRNQLVGQFDSYRHLMLDIRDRAQVLRVIEEIQPEFVIHTAAQPSHDWAAREPFTDFDVNAVGTLNLLEAVRLFCPMTPFAFMSTNKVYGDAPNHLPLVEMETRYDYSGELRGKGISEQLSIDQCLHSVFGASKAAADLMAQEYGKYFQMRVAAFRGGCLTGSRHAAVPLHGFLAYLVHCAIAQTDYQIIGYKGKQVRDQIHSSDVIRALECFRISPRCGEVYNLGGGFGNSASVLEVIEKIKARFGLRVKSSYLETNRKGDHICYYSNLEKFQSHYPNFRIEMTLDRILDEMVNGIEQSLEAA